MASRAKQRKTADQYARFVAAFDRWVNAGGAVKVANGHGDKEEIARAMSRFEAARDELTKARYAIG